MKAKVIRKFKDKYSGEMHKEGAVLNISRERFEEILTVAPLVEEIKEKKTSKKKDTAEIAE